MTAALEGVSGQQHAPAALYPWERPGTHLPGGWVDPRAGLDGRKISSELPGPRTYIHTYTHKGTYVHTHVHDTYILTYLLYGAESFLRS